MSTGDAAYIKKINRSLIIREIVNHKMISRADLSKVTDLTRATISAQVADLLEEGLIIERQMEHKAVGRKPIMLSLNSQAAYALGIDLDFGHVSFTLTNLLGQPITSNYMDLDTTNYSEILPLLIKQIHHYQSEYSDSRYGIVGIGIAIHGLVSKNERIHYVPRLKWNDIDLKADLEQHFNIPIFIDNNANLSAFAERVYVHHETENLLCVTLYAGIGIGLMMNNEFFRGHDGFAGEAGHMIIVPGGKPCNCGNKGCWEKYSSESTIFSHLSETRNIRNVTYDHIQKWLDEGDTQLQNLLEEFFYYLSIGLNNLINMYNPDVIVLDSELLRIYPDSLSKINGNLNSSISHYRKLSLSGIGRKTCVLGACAIALKQFLDVPILSYSLDGQTEKSNALFSS